MSNFSYNMDKAQSLNDSASVPLLAGEHIYKATHTTWSAPKSTPNEFALILTLQSADGVGRTVYMNLTSPNDANRNIALQTLKGFWDAAGLSGEATVQRFPQLQDKFYRVFSEEKTSKKDPTKKFVNIKTVHSANEMEFREQGLPDAAAVQTPAAPVPLASSMTSPVGSTSTALPWG